MASEKTSTPCAICGQHPFVSTGIFEKGNSKPVGIKPREDWTEARCKGYPTPHPPVTYLIDPSTLAILSVKPPPKQTQISFKRPSESDLDDLKADIKAMKSELCNGQLVQINGMFLQLTERITNVERLLQKRKDKN